MCRHLVRVAGNECTTGQWKSMEVKSLVGISDVKFVWVVYVV